MDPTSPPPRPAPVQPDPGVGREVEAAIAARRELGPDFEDSVAAGLAERVEQLAAARSAELQRLAGEGSAEQRAEKEARTQRFTLAIVSLGAGVPITAIAANAVEPGLLGVAISWAGIVAVNAVSAIGNRRSERRDR